MLAQKALLAKKKKKKKEELLFVCQLLYLLYFL